MVLDTNWTMRRRVAAWSHGREERDRLLAEYRREYGLAVAPPPARIIDELLTDFLHVKLHYDPLPLDRFAETRLVRDEIVVTVNSETEAIPGVKDVEGVQNVGKWHEGIHVIDHIDVLRCPDQQTLPLFDVERQIVCYRGGSARTRSRVRDEVSEREFWAEEAGRAAAVSLASLGRSQAFQRLSRRGSERTGAISDGWPLLYEAAADIGVNITSLTKQLQLEGLIAIVSEGGRDRVFVQPSLLGQMSVSR